MCRRRRLLGVGGEWWFGERGCSGVVVGPVGSVVVDLRGWLVCERLTFWMGCFDVQYLCGRFRLEGSERRFGMGCSRYICSAYPLMISYVLCFAPGRDNRSHHSYPI